MKKVFLFLSAALAMMAIASCDKNEKEEQDEPEKDVTVEINAANLQGTWEGAVEHDFGQGYPQKWRLQIDGENYTNWHTYQTAGTTKDEVQGLKTVGNKEKGTWAYANKKLSFTPTEQFASYYQVMKPDYSLGGNVYYDYNEETMESTPWYVTPESLVRPSFDSEWTVISLTKTALTVKINMDTFVLQKK